MLELERSIQRRMKVETASFTINALAAELSSIGREVALEYAREVLAAIQEHLLGEVQSQTREAVCKGCGIVHCGPGTLLRRGSRPRKLKTSEGEMVFALQQLTCGACRKTWSPFAEWLGLRPRQRVSEELERKLVECVTELPYQKTSRLAERWLGATVSAKTLHGWVQKRGEAVCFTPVKATKAVVADGTKVPAGASERGAEVRFSFQILGRREEHGRTVVEKRIAGWSFGRGGWREALPSGIATEVIVTDRETGLPELLAERHPEVRHQHCEWHLGHTLNHLLYLDGMKLEARRTYTAELKRIVWGEMKQPRKPAYTAFTEKLAQSPKAYTMLRGAAGSVLFEVPSAERTTSVIEREMREINRRTDVGVRWSERGAANLLRLRQARRINPDDFERIWSPVTRALHMVPRS